MNQTDQTDETDQIEQMNHKHKTVKMLLLLSLFLCPDIAHAYLDPGSGSYVLQVLLAIVIGGLYSIKVYWKKIKALFMRSASKEKDNKEPLAKVP